MKTTVVHVETLAPPVIPVSTESAHARPRLVLRKVRLAAQSMTIAVES
jgi:hypothetical protein